jgi:maltodextrin utilization protein YvdJ
MEEFHMLKIVMIIYALLLLVVAAYLLTHRKRSFLLFSKPSGELSASMTVTAVLLILCAIAAVVAGFIGSKMIALIVIAFSLLFIFLFASGLTRAMNN